MRMHLSAVRSFLGDLEGGLEAVGEEITLQVKILCTID
jgi:hypothetical protein